MPENEQKPIKVQILLEAAELIAGQREKDYGTAEVNFKRIADLWSIRLQEILSRPLTPREIAELMILLKVARATNSPTRDSYVDIGGYAGIAGELAENEDER